MNDKREQKDDKLKKMFACMWKWEPDRKSRQPLKQYQYTTTYPQHQIINQKFQSSDQISAFLLQNAMQIGYCKWQLFQKTIFDRGDHYKIVYSCRYKLCGAMLVYHQKKTSDSPDDLYAKKYYLVMIKVNNYHSHPLKLTKKLSSQQRIRQYLFDLPVQQKFQNHVQFVKQKFKLSRCQARYLKDRVFWRFKSEDHMLSKLTERKVMFRRKINEQDGKSIILVMISQSMKKNYERYGDMLCFDITYKLLMRKKQQFRHTGMGFFIGSDQNSRILLYGMAVITQQTSDNFFILFQFFFDIMCYIPQCILTDDQRALGNALQRLKVAKKYTYAHLLDWYHKVDALKKHLRREPCRQQLLRLYVRLLKEPSKQVYKDIIYEIAEMQQREQIMKDFLKDQKQCVLSQVPQKFFGFGISSTRAEAFNGLIKRSVPIQTNLGRLVFFALRVEKRLVNRMSVLQKIHKDLMLSIDNPQLSVLREHLETLAFQQLRQYYFQSLQFQIVQPGRTALQRRLSFRKYDRRYYFYLNYDVRYGCWRCQCRNQYRTGMPCPHIFKVLKEYDGCIGYYLNQRWIHDKDNIVVRKETRPDIKRKKI